jgi:heparosan-N-sulfate-glucuronate 5-epimerase
MARRLREPGRLQVGMWRGPCAAAAVAVALLLAAGPAKAACRPYLNYARIGPIAGHGPPYIAVFDEHGIPVVHYPFGIYRNPSTVAQWGLQEHSLACLGRGRRHRRRALRAARWLANSQTSLGGWTYGFEFHEGPVTLRPPWISALAQGQAISLLARAYDLSHRRRFLRVARRGLRPFVRTHDRGGVLSRWDGHPWYEEYPAVNANHVLNGYELALLGLHDLAARSPLAARLFREGVRSLVWAIPVFDGGPTGSYYAAGQFVPVSDAYLAVHVQLTRALYRLTHRTILRTYADRWEAALRSHGGT